jgi:plastocyanin
MRKLLLGLGIALVGVAAFGEEITLPAAASIVGGAPFFSDVRAFNTSYSTPLNVTAVYRCFIPSPCTSVGAPQIPFTLAPRESRAFDNMVELTFLAPNTAGGVEFDHTGESDQLVVTSRLYSTAPTPTVGMFIPGLKNSEAHPTTVLTSIRNGGPNAGFRTNVGVFNREDSAVNVTFTIFNGGSQVGTPVTRSVPGHSGAQVSGIFSVAGQAGLVTDNAIVVVTASGEVFSYAAVIDNNTTDPIFVRGAEDRAPVASTSSNRTVHVGGQGMAFTDDQGQGSTTQVQVGDTITWIWDGAMTHGVTSGRCTDGGYYGNESCDPDGTFASGTHASPFQFAFKFTQAGTFAYYCPIHGGSMKGRVVVSAPGGASRRRGAGPAAR